MHTPPILTDFDHQHPFVLRGIGDQPTRQQIHTIVRTPNGNDYAKYLLRQRI